MRACWEHACLTRVRRMCNGDHSHCSCYMASAIFHVSTLSGKLLSCNTGPSASVRMLICSSIKKHTDVCSCVIPILISFFAYSALIDSCFWQQVDLCIWSREQVNWQLAFWSGECYMFSFAAVAICIYVLHIKYTCSYQPHHHLRGVKIARFLQHAIIA